MATRRGGLDRLDRLGPPNETALIDREEELACLTEAAGAAGRGSGQVVLIAGEVGAGKTSLARASLGRGQRRDDRIYTGRAFQVESQIPYAVFTDAFQGYLRGLTPAAVADLLIACGPELAKVFPALRLADEPPVDRSIDVGARKARVFDTFYRFLRRLIPDRGSLILFLDDLHWADTASLELWHFLAHSNAADRMLLIGSYRAEETVLNPTLEHVLASLRRLEHCQEITLAPLTRAQTIALVQRALDPTLPLAGEIAEWLQGLTKGNPLFISEIVRTLLRSGRLQVVNGEWTADPDQPFHLPRSIRDAFQSRLEALSEDARQVLTVAAVLGTQVDFRILQSTTGLAEERLIAALDELHELQILVERHEEGLVRAEFAHPLMRETVYEHLGVVHRGHLHGLIALALEALAERVPGVAASQLGLHFAHSADPELRQRAIPYLIAAGEEALQRYANREAIGHFRTALSLLTDDPTQIERRIHVLEWIGLAEERVGTLDQAIASWRSAIGLAQASGDARAVARLHRMIGRALWQQGDEIATLAEFRAGLAALAADAQAVEAADLHQELAQLFARLGQIEPALEEAQQAIEIALAQGAEGVAARAYAVRVAIHGFSGRLDLAEEYAHRALEIVERHHWPRIGWRVHYLLAVFATHHGNTDQARHHADRSLADAVEIGAPALMSWPLSALAALDWQTGDWASGIEAGERAIALDRQTGQFATLPRVLTLTAALYQVMGEAGRAHAYLEEALDVLERLAKRDMHMRCMVYGGLAWYHLLAGELASAERDARQAVDLVDTRQAYPIYLLHRTGLPTLAEAQIELGDLDGAAATLHRLEPLVAAFNHRPARAAGQRLTGRLALRQGRSAEGLAQLTEGVEGWRTLAQPFELGRALRDRGQARLEHKDRPGGSADLHEAREIFEHLGAEREAAAVRQLLRSFGIRAQRRPSGHGRHPGGLTNREVEIVRLAADGLTNREIADRLFISPLTAETHLRNVLRKLNLHSRAQLGDFAERHGLL